MVLGCKVSIVIPVYQSYEVLRRQSLYWQSLDLPDDVEIIIVDDNSDPPLEADGARILRTEHELAWTQSLAQNYGAEQANGEYLLTTGIDHILSREAIMAVREFTGAKMHFPRFYGVLLEDGTFTDDLETLIEYGFPVRRLARRGLYASFHGDTYAMPRRTFLELGGYPRGASTKGYHPGPRQGPDCYFHAKWNRWAKRNGAKVERGPAVYMFPIGRYHVTGDTNPGGMFHDLSYKQERMWKHGDQN